MSEPKASDFTYINVSSRLREAAIKNAKSRIPRHRSYNDIPKFPYGYKTEEGKGMTNCPSWLDKHSFSGDPLSQDWLSSAPTLQQLLNLFYQLEQHALCVGATYLDWETHHVAVDDAEDKNLKCDCLTLPSNRVERGKTPCTAYPGSEDPVELKQQKEAQQNVGNENQHQNQNENLQRDQNQNQQQDQDKDYHQEKQRYMKMNRDEKKKYFRKHRPEMEEQKEQRPGYKPSQEQNQGQQDKGKEKEKDQQDNVPNSYHLITFRDRREERANQFIEFLREDATGYILAFRVFTEIGEATYFCCCSDAFCNLTRDLPFLQFKKIHSGSGYDAVDRVVYGDNTLEIIFDTLYACYTDPEYYYNDDLSYYLQILFVVLGEGPRFEKVRTELFARIDSGVTHADSPKLGILMDTLIHNWKNLSWTAFILKLVLLEEKAARRLIRERPNRKDPNNPDQSLVEVFRQFDTHWLLAQEHCTGIEGHRKKLNTILQLKKDRQFDGMLRYGRTAYKQIIRDQVPLLHFVHDVGPAVMVRRDAKYDEKLYPHLKEKNADGDATGGGGGVVHDDADDGGEKKKAAETDAEFWKMFKAFRVKKDQKVLDVLCSSIPYLERFFFSEHDHVLHKLVNDVCCDYKLKLSRKLSKTVAAKEAKVSHRLFFYHENLEKIWDFLEANSPVLKGSEQGRSFNVAKKSEEVLMMRTRRLKMERRKMRSDLRRKHRNMRQRSK